VLLEEDALEASRKRVKRIHQGAFDPVARTKKSVTVLDAADGDGVRGSRAGLFKYKYKNIQDPIHEFMEFHPSLVALMDTPQFQRLRGLKQLGASHLVFPGATHTRFDHSLGVAHLGMTFVKQLKARQPELGIDDVDVLCVGIAGLCHDLGHGPFSHLFDGTFLSKNKEWTHERGSALMFRYMLEDNKIDLKRDFEFNDLDLVFIEELILGKKIPGGVNARKGRGHEKQFLYDIINNERSGFDVDKLDYLLRDTYFCGVPIAIGMSVDRIFQIALVLPDENNIPTISFPEKAVQSFFNVFHARMQLHIHVYQHKVVKACELMICEVFELANDILKFKSKKTGKFLRMSESVNDMSVFCQLKDSVLDLIQLSQDPKMKPAQLLLDRLMRRDIYRSCGKMELQNHGRGLPMKSTAIQTAMLAISVEDGSGLTENDFYVEVMQVHHGQGTNNPVDGLRFHNKLAGTTQPISPSQVQQRAPRSSNFQSPGSVASFPTSQHSVASCSYSAQRCFKIDQRKYEGGVIPRRFGVTGVRVFAKSEEKRDLVAKCFVKWTRRETMSSPLCHNSQSTPLEEECKTPTPENRLKFLNNDDDDEPF